MNTKPILSCAGRQSEQIDSELLNQLLLSFRPNLMGVRNKAQLLSTELGALAHNEEADVLEEFKSIINREFLQLQLTEAISLARNATAVAACDEEAL